MENSIKRNLKLDFAYDVENQIRLYDSMINNYGKYPYVGMVISFNKTIYKHLTSQQGGLYKHLRKYVNEYNIVATILLKYLIVFRTEQDMNLWNIYHSKRWSEFEINRPGEYYIFNTHYSDLYIKGMIYDTNYIYKYDNDIIVPEPNFHIDTTCYVPPIDTSKFDIKAHPSALYRVQTNDKIAEKTGRSINMNKRVSSYNVYIAPTNEITLVEYVPLELIKKIVGKLELSDKNILVKAEKYFINKLNENNNVVDGTDWYMSNGSNSLIVLDDDFIRYMRNSEYDFNKHIINNKLNILV